jgi:hypothetical protein
VQRFHAGVERRAEHPVQPEAREQPRLLPQPRQARRRPPLAEILARRRLEGEGQRRQPAAARFGQHPGQDALVPQVQAIEGTDGGHAAGRQDAGLLGRAADQSHRDCGSEKPDYTVEPGDFIRNSRGRRPTASSVAK